MSYGHRSTTLPSHVRPSSGFGASHGSNPSASTQTSILQSRINEKRIELDNLRQLRDLSAALAGQMQQLEEKLATLSSGTEAVASVMGNWGNVLRAIHMASAFIPKPKDEGSETSEGVPLPLTLVRVPVQETGTVPAEAEAPDG